MSTDWIKKWETGDTRFHQTKYHPQLEKFGERFSHGTVLVPLCGKSLDMLYLSTHGHSVIGVELSPIACRNFFLENGLEYREKSIQDFVVFESAKITLWCGDFFKLPQKVWDEVTGVYDRAALVALPAEIRQKYTDEIVKRSTRQLEILLISFEYPEGSLQGPPFSVTAEEICKLYAPVAVEKIHTEKEVKNNTDNPRFRSIELFETTYWIHKRT